MQAVVVWRFFRPPTIERVKQSAPYPFVFDGNQIAAVGRLGGYPMLSE